MSRTQADPWLSVVRLSEVGRDPDWRHLEPDEAQRAQIAKVLGVVALPAFTGEVKVLPWHDGAEIQGRWKATVTYTCGLSLEPFDAKLTGDFLIHAVPASSPLAVTPEPDGEGELELDLDADDPPDVLDQDSVDLAGYLVEDLALDLDPFPRKPGAVFEPPAGSEPASPFAVLKRLKE